MWDLERLMQLGAFHQPWDNPQLNLSFDAEEYNRRAEDMEKSFSERYEIWLRGGRGWWTSMDERRIQWPSY